MRDEVGDSPHCSQRIVEIRLCLLPSWRIPRRGAEEQKMDRYRVGRKEPFPPTSLFLSQM